MKPCRWIPVTLLAALALVAACGRDKSVATVDGEAITAEEFNQYLATKQTVRVMVQGQVAELQVADTLAFQALQDLATQRIVMHMADDDGLMPSEPEVEDEIKFKTALNPRYLSDLKAVGYGMGQIRRDVKYSLCQERLLTRGIKVEMAEVDRMIKEKPEQFMEPATADVYQIYVLSPARKSAVDQELRARQSFKSVAAKYNQDPQGEHVQLPIERLVEPLKTMIKGASVGSQTDWVPAGQGFKKFFIEGKTEAKMTDLSPERKEYVRRQIALNYGRQANDLQKQVIDKLKSSDVAVSDDEAQLKDMWKRMEDRLDKALEASTAQG